MQAIGSRQLRSNFREYLESAEEGVEFVVLTRGRPLAILRPVRPGDEGVLVSTRVLRGQLPKAVTQAPNGRLVVTRWNRMIAVLEAAPKELSFEVREEEAS